MMRTNIVDILIIIVFHLLVLEPAESSVRLIKFKVPLLVNFSMDGCPFIKTDGARAVIRQATGCYIVVLPTPV